MTKLALDNSESTEFKSKRLATSKDFGTISCGAFQRQRGWPPSDGQPSALDCCDSPHDVYDGIRGFMTFYDA